ncbi:MAG: ribbon-helix-helix domain-containing protein [Candidatus Hydromicrobium sp.]|nr:ribbon-helix-helix domain-containing protein [Candidatus Hydromicrobium sp.]
MDKERTSILLERDIVLKLKNLARLTNKSTSFIIREALSEYITKKIHKKEINIIGIVNSGDPHFAENDEEYLKKKNFSIIGIGNNGGSDIANNEDEYLKGLGED